MSMKYDQMIQLLKDLLQNLNSDVNELDQEQQNLRLLLQEIITEQRLQEKDIENLRTLVDALEVKLEATNQTAGTNKAKLGNILQVLGWLSILAMTFFQEIIKKLIP